ncbi:hypothetical protein ACCC97_28755, partial [Variovorax sp. Varisp85]|uniref:hypothetical protein n=1 Tax=Variovorax sp. Varisp85 TaxID=3243059 RepID=UPI0039A49D50
ARQVEEPVASRRARYGRHARHAWLFEGVHRMTMVGAFLLAWMTGYVLGWKVRAIKRTLYAA